VQRVYAEAGVSVTSGMLAVGGSTFADHTSWVADPNSRWHRKLVTEADQREWVIIQDVGYLPHTHALTTGPLSPFTS
jgi:hypothetical protein